MRTAAGVTLIMLALARVLLAAERTASNGDELGAAISNAKPADAIVMRDGEWTDVFIDVTKGGGEGKPLTIRAQTPGKVVLNGSSRLRLGAPHVVVDGLVFQGGAIKKGQVIHFESDHGRVTNSAIIDYNPADRATAYYWVFFEGSDNHFDHCLLTGKNNAQPVIGNAGGGSSPDDSKKPSRRNTVDHCYIHDIPAGGGNGREIFRIWGYGGSEELGEDGAFFTIERNLLERAHGESYEIISLKSNRNIVRGNTIRATRGGITNRSGNFNRIEDNIILADGESRALGIRICGQNHIVAGNYVQDCEYGINLYAGEFIDEDLTGKYQPINRAGTPLGRVPRYGWVRNATMNGNTVVNSLKSDLVVGGAYKSGWPNSQRVLLPEGCKIEKNIFVRNHDDASVDGPAQDKTPPLDRFQFAPNTYRENVLNRGEIKLEAAKAGFEMKEVKPTPPKPLTPQEVGPGWRK